MGFSLRHFTAADAAAKRRFSACVFRSQPAQTDCRRGSWHSCECWLLLVITIILFVPVTSEKPVIRSSYIQQLMQDAAHTLQAESSNNATLNTVDNVDKVTSEHQHSSTCDTALATSSQLPVDSSKTTQQLIG